MPALKLELEDPVEERTARLEAKVDNLISDVTEIKGTIVRLDQKIDAANKEVAQRFDAVNDRLDSVKDSIADRFAAFGERFTSLRDSVADAVLTMEKTVNKLQLARTEDRIWWLLMSGALLGIMARAFKWI